MPVVEKTLRWIILAGIFALPAIAIIIANGLFFPYITGKNFAFRVIVEIITGSWLALALVLPQYRPRRSWILGAFALFVLIMAIADAQGAYPFKSFWSNYERMDGWVTIAHTLLFLIVAVSILNTENLWRRFFHWSLVVSAFLSVLGLLQVAGILTLGSGGTGLVGRVDATFGNPIYFAVYMLFHVFIAALLWYQMWQVRGVNARLAPSILFGAVIFLDTVTLLFSGTRGATLGLIGGALLALVLYALSRDANTRLRRLTAGVFVLLVVLGGGLRLARNTPLVQHVGFLARLSSISLSDDTTHARFLNMGIAWQGVKERPILGWGQENYAIVFDKYYDPGMYAQEQWFDRVHNIIFDWWIAGGTLGLLAYLSIFAATLWALWRPSGGRESTERSGANVRKNVFTPAERAILTGLLAGYFFHNLTVFDNVTSYILFAMVLGYIAYREQSSRGVAPLLARELLPRSTLPVVAAVAALLVWGGAWFVNARALAENQTLIMAIMPQGDIAKNLTYFKQAISYGAYGTQEVREQLAQIAMQVMGAQVPSDIKVQFVETAVREMNAQSDSSPLDARFPLFAGMVLQGAGDYAAAATAFDRAHQLSPRKQSILFAQAQNAQLQGNASAAVQYFKTAYELDTTNVDAHLYYAASLIAAGRDVEADQLLAPLIPTGQAADPRIANAYVARKAYGKLVPIWEGHVEAQPSDVQGYFTLAAVYYAMHDSANAIAQLKLVGSRVPSVKAQADGYIQQIQNGTLPTGQ